MAKARGHRADKANDSFGTINNESLYRGNYRDDVYKDEPEEDVNESEGPSEEATPQQEDAGFSAPKQEEGESSADYKKRYDDLKRHYDKKVSEWKHERDELLQARQAAAAQGVNPDDLPRTAEQLQQFKEKYPEVYAVMETISSQRAEDKLKNLQEEVRTLKSREEELEVQNAYKELLRKHPDFDGLKSDSKFLSWLDEQPPSIADGIYKNNKDANWASRVVDLYKADMGIKSAPAKRTSKDDPAAAVRTPAARDVVNADAGNKRIWKASEIGRLKPHQFEKYEAELDAAREEGRIDYNN
jgi:myosin heavy subunit